MRLLLVHLSDIHFLEDERRNTILARTDAISSAIASVGTDISKCFMIVSGDIAYSGTDQQYSIAQKFLSKLKDSLRANLTEVDIEYILVPGNHDCDFSKADSVREILLSNLDPDKCDPSIISKLTELQSNFASFDSSVTKDTFSSDSTGLLKLLQYDVLNNKLIFHLINTSWMSSKDERQGTLLLPIQSFDSFADGNLHSADLVVTILHHSYNWFEATNARKLREHIEASSDVILTGHEHETDQYTKARRTGERTEYMEGSILQDISDPNNSAFSVLLIDLTTQKQRYHNFFWDGTAYTEDTEEPSWLPFYKNRYRLKRDFLLESDFDLYLHDPGIQISHPFKAEITLDDIFIYPDLREANIKSDVISRAHVIIRSQLPRTILSKKNVILLGPDSAGKTTLCKVLFSDLRNTGLVPILVNGDNFRSVNEDTIDSTVKDGYAEAYGLSTYSKYRTLDKDKKVIIIDDFDKTRLNTKGRASLLKYLSNRFALIVLTGTDELRFDNIITQNSEEEILWKFEHYDILPFGNLKRWELIEKWTVLGRLYNVDEGDLQYEALQTERTINGILGRDYLPAHPFYILIMLHTLELKRSLKTTSGSLGYLYEVLITTSIAKSARRDIDIDTRFSYLTEFAYTLYANKDPGLSKYNMDDWHNKYCGTYQIDLPFDAMLQDLIQVGILREVNNKIVFRYPYIYYFFASRYLRDHITEDEVRDIIRSLSQRLFNIEAANIIMFLCYLSKDPFILESIISASGELFNKYEVCDILSDSDFLGSIMSRIPELTLDDEDPRDHRRDLLRKKDEIESEDFSGSEDYDDTEPIEEISAEERQEYLMLNAAFKTIQIMGQILRNFPGSLKREPKITLVNNCYALGLRLLKFGYQAFSESQDELARIFYYIIRDEYPNLSDKEIKEKVKNFIFYLVEGLTFSIIKHVSDSIGHKALTKTFNEIIESEPTISKKYIDLSLRLDHLRGFPTVETLKLYNDVSGYPFAKYLVRHLVWLHFYLYESTERQRQSICSQIGIKLLPETIYREKPKRKKSKN